MHLATLVIAKHRFWIQKVSIENLWQAKVFKLIAFILFLIANLSSIGSSPDCPGTGLLARFSFFQIISIIPKIDNKF